jgi:hypothetical protein
MSSKIIGFDLAFISFDSFYLGHLLLLASDREFIRIRETGLANGIIKTAIGLAVILAPPPCGIVYNQNPRAIF